MSEKIIFKKNNFRVIEIKDETYQYSDLKGDCYDPKSNPEIDPIELKKQEKNFENEVESMGVFGYVLQIWNPEIDMRWTDVDSCFGFIGQYDPKVEKYNHYIVEELKGQIK